MIQNQWFSKKNWLFSDEGPTDSQEEYEVYDEYAEFGPNYGYSQSERSSQKSIEEQETSRQEDEYDEMLDQLQSQVNSTETASGMRLRGFYTHLILSSFKLIFDYYFLYYQSG